MRLAAIGAVAHVQRMHPAEVRPSVRSTCRAWLIQAGIGLTGIPLGFVDYDVLRPSAAWIISFSPASILVVCLVILIGTGIAEELIFQGDRVHRAIQALGARSGVLFVTTCSRGSTPPVETQHA